VIEVSFDIIRGCARCDAGYLNAQASDPIPQNYKVVPARTLQPKKLFRYWRKNNGCSDGDSPGHPSHFDAGG
jgi:hypothetical protein